MLSISVALFAALLILALSQSVYVFLFSRRILNLDRSLLADEDCPQAAVVLCIRGRDPFLGKCLTAILDQDYPNYRLHIVLDSEIDPAMPLVAEHCDDNSIARIHVLSEHRSTCSLKCSSLIHAIDQIEDSCSFIAQLDSDTIPEKHWLRSLATGLSNPEVGVVSGIRWYAPPNESWGSLVRYVWNAAAIVQMFLYRISWGGTLAIKKTVFNETDLKERWSRALCEDTMLATVVQETKLRTEFRSDLFVVNRESGSLSEIFAWLSRQLLTARLYHPFWWLVLVHSISTSVTVFLVAAILMASLIQMNVWPAILLTTGLVIYQITNGWLLAKIGRTVIRCCNQSDLSTPEISLRFVIAAVLTQACYFLATISAIMTRSIQWRDIEYEIHGPWDIRMKKYTPYTNDDGSSNLKSL